MLNLTRKKLKLFKNSVESNCCVGDESDGDFYWIKRFHADINATHARLALWRHFRHFHHRPKGRDHNNLCRTVKPRRLKVIKVRHWAPLCKLNHSDVRGATTTLSKANFLGCCHSDFAKVLFFPFFLSGTKIKRLTPFCCRFARLLIPADLGDHWGRIVHHNHVCSAVPSSSVKVTDSSATRSCIKTEVYAHGKKKKKQHTHARARNETEAPRKKAQQVAYSESISFRLSSSARKAAEKSWPVKVVQHLSRIRQLWFQYGARLRSRFQDTNMEVSRLPISLKVAQWGNGRGQLRPPLTSTTLTTVP